MTKNARFELVDDKFDADAALENLIADLNDKDKNREKFEKKHRKDKDYRRKYGDEDDEF